MSTTENPGADRTEANWVDIATFVVLLLTLIAVALYTWEAMVAIALTGNGFSPLHTTDTVRSQHRVIQRTADSGRRSLCESRPTACPRQVAR